jgi:hypothetical protein
MEDGQHGIILGLNNRHPDCMVVAIDLSSTRECERDEGTTVVCTAIRYWFGPSKLTLGRQESKAMFVRAR